MTPPVLELTFRRASVHLVHDVKCLEEGADLNDAMLDFFVKLGQALIPSGDLSSRKPPVAYLGSHFYDVLCKGGAADGVAGHVNVANWATRRLGPGGLFGEDVGALAVPVNETLRDDKGEDMGKHWWLALFVNLGPPRSPTSEEEHNVLLCLDSYSRADISYEVPLRSHLASQGEDTSYIVEVRSLSRAGCHALVRLRAQGDGTAGPLLEPRASVLRTDNREFPRPMVEFFTEAVGGDGQPGMIDGYLHFELDSEAGTSGNHLLEYAGAGQYLPTLRLWLNRTMSPFQQQVTRYLRGYLHKEWHGSRADVSADEVHDSALLPDVPQQETANDCGYFILEQILLVLQLSPKTLRWLATVDVEDLSSLPWPSQDEVARRKDRLREGLGALFKAAQHCQESDVEVLLRDDENLRETVRTALQENRDFAEAVKILEQRKLQGGGAGGEAKRRRMGDVDAIAADADALSAAAFADASGAASLEAASETAAAAADAVVAAAAASAADAADAAVAQAAGGSAFL